MVRFQLIRVSFEFDLLLVFDSFLFVFDFYLICHLFIFFNLVFMYDLLFIFLCHVFRIIVNRFGEIVIDLKDFYSICHLLSVSCRLMYHVCSIYL